ncbi:MAG: ferritin [Ectothiorhodospiraceae bacterium]|nr:ferritin [Chromatiales bacterium]MCP5154493.1 ferritin [Ectothiorhodospiraceae bacterium]
MTASSAGLHEDPAALSEATKDHHRAVVSVLEELEAVDWYHQRAEAATDPELRAILEHNRDEEKEHAAMVLEWLRRRDATLDQHLRDFLFTDGPIMHAHEGEAGEEASSGDESLGIGSLRAGGAA